MRGHAQSREPKCTSTLEGAPARALRLLIVLTLALECLTGAVAAPPMHQPWERRPPLPLTRPYPHPRRSSMPPPQGSGPDLQPKTLSKLPASGLNLVSYANHRTISRKQCKGASATHSMRATPSEHTHVNRNPLPCQPAPVLGAQTAPALYAQPAPVLCVRPAPVLYAQPAPVLCAQPAPVLREQPAPVLCSTCPSAV